MEQLRRLIANPQGEIDIQARDPADEPWSPHWNESLHQYDLSVRRILSV
jgi:hypothetical protein